MELISVSLDEAGGPNATSSLSESLNGLKFGQKIYFEDPGASASMKPLSRPTVKKIHGGNQHPPKCQVEGCKVDLSGAKAYYSRHKVCGIHSKSPKVVVAGLEQRFCQQCSRFHQLSEFDQGKRSCRRRLAGHNERRRKLPSGSVLPSPYSRLPSNIFETNKVGGFLVDFNLCPKLPENDAWPPISRSSKQATIVGRSFPHQWHQTSSWNSPLSVELQVSTPTSGIGFSSSAFHGINLVDSSAPSLLSNQQWNSQACDLALGANTYLNAEPTVMVQPSPPHGADIHPYLNPYCDCMHEMPRDLGLTHISHPVICHLSSEPEQHHHGEYGASIQQIHWPL